MSHGLIIKQLSCDIVTLTVACRTIRQRALDSLTGNKAFPYWEQSIPLLGIILLISPPLGRGDAQQVAHEEVHALMVAEGLAHGVVGTGDDDQLEVLAGTL